MGKVVLMLILIFAFMYIGAVILFDNGAASAKNVTRNSEAVKLENTLDRGLSVVNQVNKLIIANIKPAVAGFVDKYTSASL